MMKKFLILLLACAFVGLAASVWAQGPGGPGMRPGPGMGPGVYNPQTVTTVKGTVESLGPAEGRRPGRMLVLKTEKESFMVHLGPASYLSEKGITLKVGDQLEVTGFQVPGEGTPAIIAREVKVGDKTLKLRNEQGMPLWRRPMPGPPKQ